MKRTYLSNFFEKWNYVLRYFKSCIFTLPIFLYSYIQILYFFASVHASDLWYIWIHKMQVLYMIISQKSKQFNNRFLELIRSSSMHSRGTNAEECSFLELQAKIRFSRDSMGIGIGKEPSWFLNHRLQTAKYFRIFSSLFLFLSWLLSFISSLCRPIYVF